MITRTLILEALRPIEGIDSTTSTRDALIARRNAALASANMGDAMLFSHAIAHLARLERIEKLVDYLYES